MPYGTDFALYALEAWRLCESAHDMRPIDIAVARHPVLVGLGVIVVQMAVDDVRKHLFQRVVLPFRLQAEHRPSFAGGALLILLRI